VKILHIGYSDLVGGGNIAAYRIHRSMVDAGYDSTMVVARKTSRDETVQSTGVFRSDILRRLMSRLGSSVNNFRWGAEAKHLAYDSIGINVARIAGRRKADIVNLHWTHGSFVAFKSVSQIKAKVVWTLHDMLVFTGGCNYAGNCRNFERACGNCPLLAEHASDFDASRQIHLLKRRFLTTKPDAVVAPSEWMQREVKLSALLRNKRTERIQYCLGDAWFGKINRDDARRDLGLPSDSLTLLFASNSGANDKRKGFDLLTKSLEVMKNRWPDRVIVVLVVGEDTPKSRPTVQNGIQYFQLGKLSADAEMQKAYVCADVFVAPSREDNLPLVAIESLASGTPVVAFKIGGFPDLVSDADMGYLAKPFDTDELATGIYMTANSISVERRARIRHLAKTRYSPSVVEGRYLQLYSSLMENE